MAQVVSFAVVPIVAKMTTHPDIYDTRLPLQMTAPVVSDLNCDGVLEIVCAGYNAKTKKSTIYVWHRKGTLQHGWPKEIDGKVSGPPAIGDMDNDGDLEILVSVSNNPPKIGGQIYVYHHDGSVYKGYPRQLKYKPGAPLFGDVKDGFGEEPLVYESDKGAAACDIDGDGKKEVIIASSTGIKIEGGKKIYFNGWPEDIKEIGSPITGDIDGDKKPEIFLALKTLKGNYIYGWHSGGTIISGWPINIAGVVNAPGNFISLGDLNGDGKAEILSGSTNGWIAAWDLNGKVVFSSKPVPPNKKATDVIYQPIVGDIDSDGNMEILAASMYGNIYCYDHSGKQVSGWPKTISSELSGGLVLVDIDSDSLGDPVNPANDLELLYSTADGSVHSADLPGDYNPNKIQWGMYGFNPMNSANYLRDWDTSGWSVFDDTPKGAKINSVYDWNRGSRVVELKGAGLNNTYAFRNSKDKPFDSKNTTLQWSMRYGLPFNIYVSIDTICGNRYLHYSPTSGSQPKNGKFIHHGLGSNTKNNRWHTYKRNLVKDLKDVEPSNEIVDINAVYVQGSGLIDDVMLLPGLPCVDIKNLALSASVTVSGGNSTKGNLNDGDPDTKWVSLDTDLSWVEYTWQKPQKINEIVIQNPKGANVGWVFIINSNGKIYKIKLKVPKDGSPIKIVTKNPINDVKSVIVVFDNDNMPVSACEICVYYDPNVEKDTGPPEKKYSEKDYIKINEGYFYDPVTKKPWIPHGIAYQTWNKALGQWQTPSELKKDLDEMKKIGVNAIRVDFVWKHIEIQDGVYDWHRYDMLLEEAQARGIKVFPLIGYQWPPDWFPKEWYTMHPPSQKHPNGPWLSDILSYEDLQAQKQFSDFLQDVTARYSLGGAREDLGDTVAGWILGNEYGYLGLWSIEYDGYDPDCQAAFRQWLSNKYPSIGDLNKKWAEDNIKTPGYLPNYPYKDFGEVDMPIPFGYKGTVKGKYLARDKASWYDLTEWREKSIAKFVALAADSVRKSDPYHLITYAAVGMQWGEEDWRYHTEDAGKITAACDDINAPLDFWSINNYPWGLKNSELMTGQWGEERARHDTGLPVMITETGFTSTETMYPGIDQNRQAKLIRNAVWEALESGAIGVCVFHWNDRVHPGLTKREEGFGIVTTDRKPKPAYYTVRDVFKKMEEINIAKYLTGSKGPAPDIAFLWDDAVDTIVNRYEAEMKDMFGTLERLGFEPTFINDEELLNGDYLYYDAIILPRNQKMFDATFKLLNKIALSGVKIHANADLPGIMDEYGKPRNKKLDWLLAIKTIFGVDAANIKIDPDLEDDIYYDGYETSSFGLNYKAKPLVFPSIGFNKTINMWKYRDNIINDSGIVKARFGTRTGPPALVFHFDSAISLFSIGDNKPIDNTAYGAQDWTWSDKYDWMKSIYISASGFNLKPDLAVSNKYILADYRKCRNKDILLSLKNYSPESSEKVTVYSSLIANKIVKDLLADKVIANPSNGSITRTLEPDGHDLLLAYAAKQTSANKAKPKYNSGKTKNSSAKSTPGPSSSTGTAKSSNSSSSADSQPDGTAKSTTSSSYANSQPGGTAKNTTSSSSANSQPDTSSSSGSSNSLSSLGTQTSTNANTAATSASSSSRTNGSSSVIIIEKKEDKKTEKGISNTTNAGTQQKSGSSNQGNRKRVYLGRQNNSPANKPKGYGESEEEIKEFPPLEQFRDTMNQQQDREMGIIRVKPEPASSFEIKKIKDRAKKLNKKKEKKPAINLDAFRFVEQVISRLKNWLKNWLYELF